MSWPDVADALSRCIRARTARAAAGLPKVAADVRLEANARGMLHASGTVHAIDSALRQQFEQELQGLREDFAAIFDGAADPSQWCDPTAVNAFTVDGLQPLKAAILEARAAAVSSDRGIGPDNLERDLSQRVDEFAARCQAIAMGAKLKRPASTVQITNHGQGVYSLGANSPISGVSQHMVQGATAAVAALDQLAQLFRASTLPEPARVQALEAIDIAKEEAAKPQPRWSRIRTMVDGVKQLSSGIKGADELAGIVQKWIDVAHQTGMF